MVAGRDDLVDRFLLAIDRELEPLDRPVVDTLFVGGGTPTHLNPDQLQRLIDCLRNRFTIAPDAEFSFEANPEDIDPEKLRRMQSAGVNRLSLGVQSFRSDKLKTLERSHDRAAAETAIRRSAEAIGNVSIDLIFAAPGESLDQWSQDLEVAMALPIRHLSTYALTFEKGTSFWARRRQDDIRAVDEATEVEMYELARLRTGQNNFEHYEVSNFALPGASCRHNAAYWEGKGWYAAGPGAARFVDGQRQVNHRSTTTYLKRIESGRPATAETESISVEQYARERAAFGVRRTEGVDIRAIGDQTGVDLNHACRRELDRAIADGLLTEESGRVKLTHRGMLFADTAAAIFL